MAGLRSYQKSSSLLRTRFCGSPLLGIDHLSNIFKEACYLSGLHHIETNYREYTTIDYVESDIFAGIQPGLNFEESEIDLLVVFNQSGYERNVNYIRNYGHLIVDRGNVKPQKTEKFTISGIPAIDITRGKTGATNSAGFALMGHLACIIDGISREAFMESIRTFHPGDEGKLYLEIFELGYSISSF